jgi:hypothetical protein
MGAKCVNNDTNYGILLPFAETINNPHTVPLYVFSAYKISQMFQIKRLKITHIYPEIFRILRSVHKTPVPTPILSKSIPPAYFRKTHVNVIPIYA